MKIIMDKDRVARPVTGWRVGAVDHVDEVSARAAAILHGEALRAVFLGGDGSTHAVNVVDAKGRARAEVFELEEPPRDAQWFRGRVEVSVGPSIVTSEQADRWLSVQSFTAVLLERLVTRWPVAQFDVANETTGGVGEVVVKPDLAYYEARASALKLPCEVVTATARREMAAQVHAQVRALLALLADTSAWWRHETGEPLRAGVCEVSDE